MDNHQGYAHGFSGQGALMDPEYVRDAMRAPGEASHVAASRHTDWALVVVTFAACVGMAALSVVR